MRYKLSTIDKHHVEKIRLLRNNQLEILRQFKPISFMEQEEYFYSIHKDQRQILFSILEEDKFIGYCGLTNINYVYGTAEVSFIVDQSDEECEGVFLFCLQELCGFAFNTLNLNKVHTETYEFRKKIIGLIEKSGFKKDGILREHVYKNGKRYNSFVHSLLSSDREI